MADRMSIDSKPNHSRRDGSEESIGSTSDREHHQNNASNNNAQDTPQPKRKGGRKPIYATSEERKQRNRQAQAAFRERRTEYIKQLEETIRAHETNLHNLQSAHRTAAEECLMLRYKNSLLERILLEKGIDVQAELQAKTDGPGLGQSHIAQNLVQPPIQRAMMNRHHSRKSASALAPKSDLGLNLTAPLQPHKRVSSPKSRPTPSSHSNSPNVPSSAFSPAPSDNMSIRGSLAALAHQQMTPLSTTSVSRQSNMQTGSRSGAVGAEASFYPTPSFQNHVEQLEQEYEADMVDESEIETPSGPGPYPSAFGDQSLLLSPASTGAGHQVSGSNSQYPSMSQLLDQNTDWDPFGLSASMAFPSQTFQFDQSDLR